MRRYVSLRGRREFALVLRRGKSAARTSVSVVAFAPHHERANARVGIVITKKVGNAVLRNRLRRRCRAILDQHDMSSDRHWFVIQCKPDAAQLSFSALRSELLAAIAASSARAARSAHARSVRA